jgi:hypothetical protein
MTNTRPLRCGPGVPVPAQDPVLILEHTLVLPVHRGRIATKLVEDLSVCAALAAPNEIVADIHTYQGGAELGGGIGRPPRATFQ